MTFLWPGMLILLILIPLFVLLYLLQQRRRKRLLEMYGSFGLLQNAQGHAAGRRRHLPPALFLAGLTILLISLARPQATINLPRIEGTVLLAFDVSGSMAADDYQPNRMEAAKAAARAFVARQPPNVKIGVIAFSDNGFAVQAPTNDQDAILAAIDRLTPQGGTALAHGILASLNLISTGTTDVPTPAPGETTNPVPSIAPEVGSSSVILLLSDGENNEAPNPLEIAQEASEVNVRIYTIGIGSIAGANLKVEGFTVHTQLNEDLLQQVAKITGGEYFRAENEEQLLKIYDNIAPQLMIKPEKIEVTAIFAGLGVLILLVGGAFSLLWFSRLP